MDQGSKESEVLFADSGRVDRLDSRFSRSLDGGIVLERVVVVSSGENSIGSRESSVVDSGFGESRSSEMVVNQGISEGTIRSSSDLVGGVILQRVIMMSCSEQDNDLGSSNECLALNGGVMNEEADDERGDVEGLNGVESKSSTPSSNLVNRAVIETGIMFNSEENVSHTIGECEVVQSKVSELGSSKLMENKSKEKIADSENPSCVIDMKSGDAGGRCGRGNSEGDKVCRICHLSEASLEADATATIGISVSMDLIQLGCGCKDELGIAHSHCAGAWFMVKGNRICEICGKTAENVTGIWENRFMEEWNDHRFLGTHGSLASDRGTGCWRGQPFCNFLMACLVLAFVLPWFFRIDLF